MTDQVWTDETTGRPVAERVISATVEIRTSEGTLRRLELDDLPGPALRCVVKVSTIESPRTYEYIVPDTRDVPREKIYAADIMITGRATRIETTTLHDYAMSEAERKAYAATGVQRASIAGTSYARGGVAEQIRAFIRARMADDARPLPDELTFEQTREREAKLALLAHSVRLEEQALDSNAWNIDAGEMLLPVASIWREHPDFREEWRA